MWSCGVIMYLLFAGRPPFYESSKDATIAAIKKAPLDLSGTLLFSQTVGPTWTHFDPEAKDLITKMLTRDPAARISAEAALKHPWMRRHKEEEERKSRQEESLIETLRLLRNFSARNTLQKAVLSYMASQHTDAVSEKQMRAMFNQLDADHNGYVTTDELISGYQRVYKDWALAKRDAAEVVKMLDVNQNGVVDYNGFLPVCNVGRVPDGEHEVQAGAGPEESAAGVRDVRPSTIAPGENGRTRTARSP